MSSRIEQASLLRTNVSVPPKPRRKRVGRAVRSPVSLLGMGCLWTRPHMTCWHAGDVRFLAVAQLGERYRRYRLPDPDAEAAMAGSLRRYGQLTPLVVCLREETHEVLDGFKRLAAARTPGPEDPQCTAAGGRRARGQGRHLRAQPDRPSSPGVGRSLDRSCPGARGRHDPGRGRRAAWAGTRAGSAGGWRWSRSWPTKPGKTSAWGCCRPPPRGHWCGCRPATRPKCWRRCTATT